MSQFLSVVSASRQRILTDRRLLVSGCLRPRDARLSEPVTRADGLVTKGRGLRLWKVGNTIFRPIREGFRSHERKIEK